MALGYDGKLFILAFDHRGSFQKKMFGIEGDPDEEQTRTISDAKHLIFEGMLVAGEKGLDEEASGVLVDEQFGGSIPSQAKENGFKLAMPVEKSGQNEFDFQYGEDGFGEHIEKFDPAFSKVLVRYNPDDPDTEMNKRQLERLESVGGDADRYDTELRPELMRRAIEDCQDFGIEVDIWKIEGVDEQSDCEMLAQQTRKGEGREGVVCVVLGRGASDDKVDHWLRAGAPVEGYVGFAIGRSIWWDALKGFLSGDVAREDAAQQIADKYLRFVKTYQEAESAVSAF
jgi:myo-inositol catabolism protein IolC